MTSIIKFPRSTLAIRDFDGVTRDNDNKPLNILVFMDLASPLASELEQCRARWARKLVALLRPKDRLTIWWFTSNEIFGSFIHNHEIHDPTTEIPDFLEKTLTLDNLRPATLSLEGMVAKANHLYVECTERQEGLIGYTDVDGFMMESAQKGLFTLMANAGRYLRTVYVCEYSDGSTLSSFFTNGAAHLGRKFFLGKDQYEEQVSFELAVREIAGERMAEVNISKSSPKENYGFVLFLVGPQAFITPCDEEDVVILPAEVHQFAYFSDEVPESAVEFLPQLDNSPLVWVAAAFAELVDEDIDIEGVLVALGDVYLGNQYVEGHEAEDYCRYEAACLEAAFDPRLRYRQGMSASVAELANLPASEVENMLQDTIDSRTWGQKEPSYLGGFSGGTYLRFTAGVAAFVSALYLGYELLLK